MPTPFPVLRLRDGFTGQNTHLRPAIETYQTLASAVSEFTLTVDGWYGNDAAAVTTALQTRYGFYADGTVRPALFRWLTHLKDHPEDRIAPPPGVSLDQLVAIVLQRNEAHARAHLDGLNQAMAQYDVSTPLRQAHFLAQVAHESGGLRWNEELASGSAYEGRRDLGNTQPGDGRRFKGRGLIQLTGRHNYGQYTDACKARGDDVDFVANPTQVANEPNASDVAGWYWDTRKINALADQDDVRAVTRKINGGLNGLADREAYLARAKRALGI